MRTVTRRISACSAGLLAFACLGACGGGGSGDAVVARVGAAPIAKAAVEHWSSVKLGSSGRAAGTPEALRLLISADWTLGEAGELGVVVTDGEARDELALFQSTQSQGVQFEDGAKAIFDGLIGRSGETGAGQVWLMKLNLLALRLERKRLEEAERGISHREITRYYAEDKQRFVLPERRDLEVLGSHSETVIKQATRDIKAGANFVEVAKRVSIDPEAPNGLQLGLRRGQEEPEYEKHVFTATPGVLVGPFSQSFYYIFKVLKVTPARLRTLAQSEASIRAQIVAGRRNQLAAQWQRDDERKWTAQTDCRSYVVPKCRQYAGSAQP